MFDLLGSIIFILLNFEVFLIFIFKYNQEKLIVLSQIFKCIKDK